MLQDIANRRLDQQIRETPTLAAPAQDPVDLEARNPHAEATTFVGGRRRDDLAVTVEREQPSPRVRCGEVAQEVAVGILHVNGGEGHRARDARHGIGLDHLAAHATEQE